MSDASTIVMGDKWLHASELKEKYRVPDDEHPVFTRSLWVGALRINKSDYDYWRWVESKLDAYFEGQGRKYLIGQRVILNGNEIGIITDRSGSDKFSVRSLTSKIIRDFVSISDIKPLPGGQL